MIESGSSLPRRGASATSNTEPMLRMTNWALRSIGLIALGVTVATNNSHDRHPAIEIAVFIIACLIMAWWGINDRSAASRAKIQPFLPATLAVVAVTSRDRVHHPRRRTADLPRLHRDRLSRGRSQCRDGLDGPRRSGYSRSSARVSPWDRARGRYWATPFFSSWACSLVAIAGLTGSKPNRPPRCLPTLNNYEKNNASWQRWTKRARIAREIHDAPRALAGALGVQIQTARAVLTDQHDVERTVELLDQAQRLASDGLSETRRAVHALRSDTSAASRPVSANSPKRINDATTHR